MEFCPSCGMLLQFELPHMGKTSQLFCPVCPYVCPIDPKVKIQRKQLLVKKEIDPIISKEDEMKLAQETEVPCPNCGHGKAFFEQVQIRSADEPMTIFYKCKECKHDWKEN